MKNIIYTFLFSFLMACSFHPISSNRTNRVPSGSFSPLSSCISKLKGFFTKARNTPYKPNLIAQSRIKIQKIITKELDSRGIDLSQWIKEGNIIEFLEVKKALETPEDKVAFLDIIVPFEKYGLPNLINLNEAQKKKVQELLNVLNKWNFKEDGSGVHTIQVKDYLFAAHALKKAEKKKWFQFLSKISDSPKELVHKWYIYNVYEKGVIEALGKLYVGDNHLSKFAKFYISVIGKVKFLFKSILSLNAAVLDAMPVNFNASKENISHWASTPFKNIEGEMQKHFKIKAHMQAVKNWLSFAFLSSATIVINHQLYQFFSKDNYQKEATGLLKLEKQMIANEVAYKESLTPKAKAEIIELLKADGADEDDLKSHVMIESARQDWIEQRVEQILNTL